MIDIKNCPDCGHTAFFHNKEKGEVICRNCSYVIDDTLIDFGEDTRSFDFEELSTKSRTGAPFDPRVANNLTTSVGNSSDIDKLPKKTKMLMQRIRKKNSWTSSSLEVNFSAALTQLRLISSYVRLPDQVEREAAVIYRRAAEKGLTIKRSIESIVVGSAYIAARQYGLPKTMDEFVKASKIPKKVLGKTYKMIVRELDIKITPSNPIDYIERFGSALGLSAKTQTEAIKMIEKSQKEEIVSGLSPVSVAATTLYLSALKAGERRTQKEVSEATNITEATLRSRCKDFMKALKIKVKIR